MINNSTPYHKRKFGYNIKNKEGSLNEYISYLLARTQSMFTWHGLPETIPQRHLERLIQTNGYVIIAEVKEELYALEGSLGGELNAYNEATKAIVSNPWLNVFKEYEIGEDCVVATNDVFMLGLTPIFKKYGTLLVEGDLTIYNALVLARGSTFLTASDNRTLANANEYLRTIENGNLTAIGESAFFDGIKSHSALNQNLAQFSNLIEMQQYHKASCLNEIGLNANWNAKRQALGANEAAMNDDNLYPFVHEMLNSRLRACEEINSMFNTSLSVELNSSWRLNDDELKERVLLDVFEDGVTPEAPEDYEEGAEIVSISEDVVENAEGGEDSLLLDSSPEASEELESEELEEDEEDEEDEELESEELEEDEEDEEDEELESKKGKR